MTENAAQKIADMVYPIDGKSSQRLNADFVRRILLIAKQTRPIPHHLISGRLFNCLITFYEGDYTKLTFENLAGLSQYDYMNMPGVGIKTFNHAREVLVKNGYPDYKFELRV